MKKIVLRIFWLTSMLFAQTSYAQAQNFVAIPTNWQVESYSAQSVVLWYTPATCTNGEMFLPSTATATDHNRLYATVIAGKSANLPVFVWYTVNSQSQCVITSFGFAAQ